MQDLYTWRLHLADGTTFAEIDPDGTEHGFGETDPALIVGIELVARLVVLPPIAVGIPADATPIFKRTRAANATQGGESYAVATYVGWERDGQRSMLILWADGSMSLAAIDPLG